MRKDGIKSGVILLIIGALFLHSTLLVHYNSTTVLADSPLPKIYVDDDFNSTTPGWNQSHFNTIQNAIDAASDGDRIIVYEGIYHENIIIDKTIDIFGEDSKTTIIDGGNQGSVVTITAPAVDLSTFTIRNSATNRTDAAIHISSGSGNIIENTITDCACGIYIDKCHNNIIAQNNISNTINATYLISSNNTIIEYNTFHENDQLGIFLNGTCTDNIIRKNTIYSNAHYAIYLNDVCLDNTIYENTIFENLDTGIRVEDDVKNTDILDNEIIGNGKYGIFIVGSNSYIYQNTISNNGKHGIFLFADEESIVEKNSISSNELDGIRMQNSTNVDIFTNHIMSNDRFGIYLNYYCLKNEIYNNYFSKNAKNAKDISPDNSENNWYHTNISSSNIISGPIIAGNYWDDYNGEDKNRDGIGDTSYPINGGNKTDKTPIVHQRPVADAGGPYSGSVYESITFNASDSYDVNETMNLSYFWTVMDEYADTGEEIQHTFQSPGNYSIQVTVVNDHGGNDTDTTYAIITPDKTPPTIQILTHEHTVTDSSTLFTIKASIQDNVAVNNVTMSYWMDNKTNKQSAIMNEKQNGIYQKTIMISAPYPTFYCVINAIDASGNSNTTTNPFAEFECSDQVNTSEIIEFDASDSFDLDGEILFYNWSFGDGITKGGANTTHEFSTDGSYLVTLTIIDNDGNIGKKSETITVLPIIPFKASNETMHAINSKGILSEQLTAQFICYDTDGDGKKDMFLDPNGVINLVSIVDIDDETAFLLSIDDEIVPEFFWKPNSDIIKWITVTTPSISEKDVSIDYQSEEATLTFTVDKTGWIWITLKDTVYPNAGIKSVRDATGSRTIPDNFIWRKNGYIYILDDPANRYNIIFENIFPKLEAEFTPGDSGIINEFQKSITVSYNVPVDISFASFNDIKVTDDITFINNNTIEYIPPGYYQNGTYTFIIDAEAVYGNELSTDAATYIYFQYELPPQPSFIEKYGLMIFLVLLTTGGGLFYGICRFKEISFDSYIFIKNKKIFPFIKPVVLGPMSVTVEKENVSKAEFYVDGILKGTVSEEPFVWQWNEPGFLTHSIKAKIFDTSGKSISSPEMNVFIINPFKWNPEYD